MVKKNPCLMCKRQKSKCETNCVIAPFFSENDEWKITLLKCVGHGAISLKKSLELAPQKDIAFKRILVAAYRTIQATAASSANLINPIIEELNQLPNDEPSYLNDLFPQQPELNHVPNAEAPHLIDFFPQQPDLNHVPNAEPPHLYGSFPQQPDASTSAQSNLGELEQNPSAESAHLYESLSLQLDASTSAEPASTSAPSVEED